MAFEVGSVIAHIKADISDFKKGIGEAKSEASGLGSHLSKIGSGIADFGKQAAVFTGVVSAGIAVFSKQSVDAFNESEAAIAQLQAVLKSTGGVAGVTAEEAIKLAASLQKTTTYGDEAVLSAENMLLTFTNISKKVFPEATETVLNMSTALGQDTKNSAIQLGKALQDPVLGITALRRVGVNFSDKQKDVIQKLVDTGHTLEAQKLILKELNTEFGGSAAAAATTFAGRVEILKNRFNDFQETIGLVLTSLADFAVTGNDMRLFDALSQIVDEGTADKIVDFLMKLRDVFVQVGEWISANQALVTTFLQGMAIAIGALMVVGTITMLLGLLLNPLFLVAAAITALYVAWQTNFLGIRDITTAVVGFVMDFFTNTFMPFIMMFVEWFTERWTFIQLIIQGVWNVIIGIIKFAWAVVYGILSAGLELLSGDWKGAWERIKQATNMAWNALKQIFTGIVQFIVGWGAWLVAELVRPFADAWNRIKDFVNKIKDALDFTKRHSPSVVDIVQKGVRLVNSSLEDLTMGINPTVGAVGAMAGAGMTSQAIAINIDLNGAIIAGDADAMRISEKIGDSIIKKLKLNLRV